MNETFNINRFGNYFVSDLKKCLSNYGITLGLLAILEIIAFIFVGTASVVTTGEWTWLGPMARLFVVGTAVSIIVLTLPSSCYGNITNKRSGSNWLMIPVSTFEKYLSMILNSAIILPGIYFISAFTVDVLLCTIAPGCGASFIDMLGSLNEFLTKELGALNSDTFRDLCNPLLYIDDFIGSILIFLLGAVIFNRYKSVLTIIALIIISSAVGMIASPIVWHYTMDTINTISDTSSPEMLLEMPLLKNISLLDTLNDMIVVIVSLIAIFFRIKTLKH